MKKGFTLIELLVVIAIIGILSSIAMINLNSARNKAKIAAAQGSLASIINAAVICQDGEGDLAGLGGAICPGTGVPAGGVTPLCVGGTATDLGFWPTLPSGWNYTVCASAHGSNTFSFGATDGTVTIDCDNTGNCTP